MLFKNIFFITVCLFLLAVWLIGVISQFLMIKNRKPDVKLLDRRILFNPFNVQFFGQRYLTDKGIYWRNRSWCYLSVFFIILIIILSLKFIFIK